MSGLAIQITANFEANLNAIEAYWDNCGFPQGFDRLLDELEHVTFPNLEQFPLAGRPFLSRRPTSREAIAVQKRLRAMMGRLATHGDVREYLMRDYLLLYAILNETVYLLSIRHQKQVSFDFQGARG